MSECHFLCFLVGARLGVQPTHDPVRHGEDEGIPGRSRNVAGSDVQNCQRVGGNELEYSPVWNTTKAILD